LDLGKIGSDPDVPDLIAYPPNLPDWDVAQALSRRRAETTFFDRAKDALIRSIFRRMKSTGPGETLPALQMTTYCDDVLITTEVGSWTRSWGEILEIWCKEYDVSINMSISQCAAPMVANFAAESFAGPTTPLPKGWSPRFIRHMNRSRRFSHDSCVSTASTMTIVGRSSEISCHYCPTDSSGSWSPFLARIIPMPKKLGVSNDGPDNIVLVHMATKQDVADFLLQHPSVTMDLSHAFRHFTIINNPTYMVMGRSRTEHNFGVWTTIRIVITLKGGNNYTQEDACFFITNIAFFNVYREGFLCSTHGGLLYP